MLTRAPHALRPSNSSAATTPYAWATLVVLLLSVAGGTVMFAKTEFRGETIDRRAAAPADTRVAEKCIPKTALYGHGLGAAVLIVRVVVVAL